MKKTFELTHPKIQVARLVEAIKHEVKKYLKRERNKALPQGVDFLGFLIVSMAIPKQTATTIHKGQINESIDEAEKLEIGVILFRNFSQTWI